MKSFTIVGLGELLWDLLPGQKKAGGAPANFAFISNLLGDAGVIASRIGSDELGAEMVSHLHSRGMKTEFIQRDPGHGTGTVNVRVGTDGQPSFDITEHSAWDFLEWSAAWKELAGAADVICYGTLAQRNPQARATIASFLSAAREEAIRVFDMNLRQQFYSAEILEQSLRAAQVVKLNEDEAVITRRLLNAPVANTLDYAKWLRDRFQLKLVCVTFGARGSLLVDEASHQVQPGFSTEVADAVGAGDAFTAAMMHHYLRGSPLSSINYAANRMGALVAGKHGAMPDISAQELEPVLWPSPPSAPTSR